MNLKRTLLCIAAIAFAMNGMAQDRIYKKNGDVIEGKVKSVDGRNITYKRADNAKGPDYTVGKNELDKVEYENGTEDVFNDRRRKFDDEDDDAREIRGHSHEGHGKKGHNKIAYGSNLVTLSPIQVTENGFGIGMSYEHQFGKKGIIGLYMPFMLTFGVPNGDVNSNGTPGSSWDSYTNFAAMIGPKLYPGGSKGKVKYGIAPVLSIVSGQRHVSYYTYDATGTYIVPVDGNKQNFQFGGMLIHSLNMNPGKHLYIGLELGWGFTFVDIENNVEQDSKAMAEFAFKIGYRF